jgi:hypothetical protein
MGSLDQPRDILPRTQPTENLAVPDNRSRRLVAGNAFPQPVRTTYGGKYSKSQRTCNPAGFQTRVVLSLLLKRHEADFERSSVEDGKRISVAPKKAHGRTCRELSLIN